MPRRTGGFVNNLPLHPTPFIGRGQEIAQILTLLEKPACRLLTLLGPGGVGKTRLAEQVAVLQAESFAHGACFVPLQAIQSTDFLVSAIADGLNISLAGQEPLAEQLLNYLRDKELLLVLDNFEQLLADRPQTLLCHILSGAPGVNLLVTSRATLNVQEEWLFSVDGLAFPQKKSSEHAAQSEAVQLFAERARRVRRDFSPAGELEDVARICRLVEGVPLAVELAAAWTKSLTCGAIAAEIERNLDILATRQHNAPDRQQSMRVVFDQTWQQLPPTEQAVFRRLSVFRDGFQREAAEQVAGASLAMLARFQDNSLLRWSPDGRYHIHELLRQYAAEHLARSADELAQTQDAHCACYAGYIDARNPDYLHRPQIELIAEIAAELKNIRAAWQWAIRQNRIADLKRMARPLGIFCNFQSRYAEGLAALTDVSVQLAGQPESETAVALLDVLMAQSWMYLRFGRLDDIEAAMTRSQALYRHLNRRPAAGYITDPDVILGFVYLIKGDYPTAVRHAEQARQYAETHRHLVDLEFSWFLQAQAALAQGQYVSARNLAQQAFNVGQQAGDQWFAAYVHNTLGDVANATQQYAAAQQHYQMAFAIRQAFNDAEGMAVALNHLGKIALRQQRFADARRIFEQSMQLYQEISDKGGLATSLHGMACASQAEGDFAAARKFCHRALQLAADIWYVPLLLTIVVDIGELLCRTGRAAQGIWLFAQIQGQPAADQETKDRADNLTRQFKLQLRSDTLAAAMQSGQAETLESTVKYLLVELPTLELAEPAPDSGEPPASPNQALVEPLTGRELEVLHYLAEGCSNREIAARLTLAEGTVKYYTRQIYGKLQVRNRTQAVTLAQELKLV